MSPLDDNDIEKLKFEIAKIRRGKRGDHFRPHKLILLLTVIEMAERGYLDENKIKLNDQFIRLFESYFGLIRRKDDLCQPGPPFFHLRSSGFWFHKIVNGREDIYAQLRTSGGGLQIIYENIEYAYLRKDFYQAICKPYSRKELRGFITSLLNPWDDLEKMPKRLGAVFHETFSLLRPAISQVLNALVKYQNESTISSLFNLLRKETNLGKNYIKSMSRYCFGTGLINQHNKFTAFGTFVQKTDPLLDHIGTQWLMHYHLSAPHGPGPIFWHEIVTHSFRIGDEFSIDEISNQIGDIYERIEDKPLVARSARSTATIFLGTYTKSDGLAKLDLLEALESDLYKVLEPDPPPTWVVAYPLLHFQVGNSRGQKTINLNDLYGEKGLSNIFMISRGRMNLMLEEMQQAGILQLFLIAPPYQVVLLDENIDTILKKVYGV